MYNIAKASEQDRRVLFRNTAQQTGLHEAIIEKDFWVCLTLDHLFHHSPWKAAFTFKGGTSLSKCYGLIQRFSEDIDLILDWRVLGYGLYEPWAPRSNTKQDQFNKEANERAEQFLRDILLPSLRSEFSIILGMEADLYIDPDDEQTICFRYCAAYYSRYRCTFLLPTLICRRFILTRFTNTADLHSSAASVQCAAITASSSMSLELKRSYIL